MCPGRLCDKGGAILLNEGLSPEATRVLFYLIGFLILLAFTSLILRGVFKGATTSTDTPRNTESRAQVYTISLPQGTAWEPKRAYSLMEHLLSLFGSQLDLRILIEPGQVLWQIIDPRSTLSSPAASSQAIQALYPSAEVTVSPYTRPELTYPFIRFISLAKLKGPFYKPLLSVNEIKKVDPLASLVQAMSGLTEGERLVFTLHIWGSVDKKTWRRGVKKTQFSYMARWRHRNLQLLGVFLTKGRSSYTPLKGTGVTGKGRYIQEDQKVLEQKLYEQHLFNAHLLLEFDFLLPEQADRLDNLSSVISNQFATTYNWWTWPDFDEFEEPRQLENPIEEQYFNTPRIISRYSQSPTALWKSAKAVLSIEELAALWHLPHDGFAATEIAWAPIRKVAPATLVKDKEGVLIGYNVLADRKNPIRLSDKSRETHVNIVGRTGVGKSTLMHNLIHQDIKDGKGVGVVDPHGKLVSDILCYSIPDDRVDDVVVIDIANEEYPPPLNPMIVPGERSNIAAGQVIAVLDKIYDIKAQRAEDALTAALVTLWQDPTPTVRDVVKLFTNIEYRHRFLDNADDMDDIVTLEFWEEFQDQSPSVQRDLSRPVIHRMRHFYRNPTLYPMMCHPEAFDFSRLIRDRKIILISLGIDERKVPAPEQQLLGAVLVSQLQMAAMGSLEKATPFFLYIDEVQNFVTTSLDKLLDEARKFGLHLTMANQYLGQLKGRILDSVMGNVGATIVFQIGLNDARLLGSYFKPEFSAEDLVNLDVFTTAVKMRSKEGQTLPAFSIHTMPPPGDTESGEAKERERLILQGREQVIRKRSVDLYTPKTRQDVLDWLGKRYPRPKFGGPKKDTDGPADEDWVVPEG